jgi:hypothetical protein
MRSLRLRSNGDPPWISGTSLIMTLLALTTSLAILECMALALVTVGFGWLLTHLYTNY